MKKILVVILSALILCTASACASSGSSEASDTASASSAVSTVSSEESKAEESVQASAVYEEDEEEGISLICEDSELKTELEDIVNQFEYEGMIYITKGGKTLAEYAGGEPEDGIAVDAETPMPVGSVSKQFCAAAILKIQEEGKLSIEDTLSKYYPEYTIGKDIKLKYMLSNRSGITNFFEGMEKGISNDYTYEQNSENIKKMLFEHELNSEPDSKFEYSNSNFFLLADILEQITGEKYEAYIRKNFFEPLGMTHTGTINEMLDGASFAKGAVYKKIDSQRGLTKGAGDILSTGEDITLWLKGLSEGKIISQDSYKLMTENYSPGNDYGYGLYLVYNGVGHPGAIGQYTAYDFINTDKDFTVVIISSTLDTYSLTNLVQQLSLKVSS